MYESSSNYVKLCDVLFFQHFFCWCIWCY